MILIIMKLYEKTKKFEFLILKTISFIYYSLMNKSIKEMFSPISHLSVNLNVPLELVSICTDNEQNEKAHLTNDELNRVNSWFNSDDYKKIERQILWKKMLKEIIMEYHTRKYLR